MPEERPPAVDPGTWEEDIEAREEESEQTKTPGAQSITPKRDAVRRCGGFEMRFGRSAGTTASDLAPTARGS